MQKIETKVIAAGAGAGLGATLGKFLLWFMGTQIWHVPNDAAHDAQATAAVPGSVAGLVVVLLAVSGAAISGYAAPHTTRLASAPYMGGGVINSDPLQPSPPLPSGTDDGSTTTEPAPPPPEQLSAMADPPTD